MSGIEWNVIIPDKLIQDIEESVKVHQENKYAFQVGLRDLDFDVNDNLLKVLGIRLPFQEITQAEQALQNKAILPARFVEDDNTEHLVLLFDHRPVGFSGFMDCVTHSLALTNLGLFEVGRFPAMQFSTPGRYWKWFLHRRLATSNEVNDLCIDTSQTSELFMQRIYQSMTEG